ncbi:NAD(P)/FAD-dependent oxidoreductase [Prescottella sp. R16]|uniref:flavin-containing monooxygenase n=1 Tax=Prescottella sp. R16 TaxID=3064529 RepID=UPI00272E19ED|nr:NAD(P)/FAD-dependent oxidoreductase [Prescottella sp. R16]
MTVGTDTTLSSCDTGAPTANPDVLREHLRQADPGVLLAILVQLTGETAYLDRYAAAISHVPDPPEHAGRTDPDTAEALVDELLRASSVAQPDPDRALELFGRLVPVALGVDLDAEFLPMLAEQGGFRPAGPVRISEHPPKFDLAIIGGGLAGIAAAISASREGLAYRIFERNEDLGGTWLTQTYPGVGVDTPSSYYSLSSELNPGWSSYYPKGSEYQEYLRRIAAKHEIYENTRFGTEVTSLSWDDSESLWDIHVRNADGTHTTSRAAVVVTAMGYLNRPKYPDVPGIESFAGTSIHSGEWDPTVDLAGKRVVVVGAGCTSAQIVDSLVDDVEHLTLFQRQPHWVAPRKRDSDDVPEHQRWLSANVPFYANWIRLKAFWGSADSAYPVVIVDPDWAATHLSISRANDFLLQDCLAYIDRTFGAGSELAAKLTPDFAPFGKRIIRDPGGYYAALTREHVDVVAEAPARVVPEGIVTQDGRLVAADVIVYATGFHLDFLSTIDIRGRNGHTLRAEWGDDPRAYRGGTVPGFPNLFITSAPNANPSHGAGNNFGIEVAVHFLLECLHLMSERGVRSIEPTRQAYDDYVEQIDTAMENTVWRHTDTAHTYYRNADGRVVVACPWRLVDVWNAHRTPVAEHFVLR